MRLERKCRTVGAGETVYVGNFNLACSGGPILWREYTPRGELPKLLAEFKSKYPFLNLDDVQFRLFRTFRSAKPRAASETSARAACVARRSSCAGG